MCEITIQRSKNDIAKKCSRTSTYVAETFIDEKTTQIKCCAQHKSKAVESLMEASKESKRPIINTQVKLENIHRPSMVEYFSKGIVEFGPQTEVEFVSNLLRECDGELLYLQNMSGHPYQSDWEKELYKLKYIKCAKRYDYLKTRLKKLKKGF